jgi:hypothetical protein
MSTLSTSTISLFNDAEQNERAVIVLTPIHREQLFRLRGYLEGVGAPKEMSEAFNDLLDLATGDGVAVGRARVRRG